MALCSKTELLLRNGLATCGQLYKHEMEGFYPRGGLIDESNLVRLYIEALRSYDNKPSNIYAWTEYLNGHGKRVDAVIKVNDDLVLLEAKRIKQGSRFGKSNAKIAISSIGKDSARLFTPSFYKKMEDNLRNNSVFSGDIYRVLISAIWLYKDPIANVEMNKAKQEWINKKAFSKEWNDCYTAEAACIDLGVSKKSDLSLLIAIAKN